MPCEASFCTFGDDGVWRFGHDALRFFDLARGGFECFGTDLIQRREADGDHGVDHLAFDTEFFGDEHADRL